MIVDAHHHFWDPATADYPWMTDELASIRRRFGPEDLAPLLAQSGVDRTVLVQTRSSPEETLEFLAIAAANPIVAGVVGWADLTSSAIQDAIAILMASHGGDRLVGIRHQVHDEANPAWLLRPDVQRGIAAVGQAGLVYELLVRPRELPAALETVRALPDVRFVIDHLAKPPIRAAHMQPWADLIAPFGGLPNVWCKVSGMVTEADTTRWQPRDFEPFVDHAVGVFGVRRLIFGSDWPVCLLAASYAAVRELAEGLLSSLSPDERSAVFGDTAEAVYGLGSTG
jgi:L-fuconolactonase